MRNKHSCNVSKMKMLSFETDLVLLLRTRLHTPAQNSKHFSSHDLYPAEPLVSSSLHPGCSLQEDWGFSNQVFEMLSTLSLSFEAGATTDTVMGTRLAFCCVCLTWLVRRNSFTMTHPIYWWTWASCLYLWSDGTVKCRLLWKFWLTKALKSVWS